MELSPASPDVGYFCLNDPRGDSNMVGARIDRASAAAALSEPGTLPVALVTGYLTPSVTVTGFDPDARPALASFSEAGDALYITYDTWFWGDAGHPDTDDVYESVFLLELSGTGQSLYTATGDDTAYAVSAYTSSDGGQTVMVSTPGGSPVVIDAVKLWRIGQMPTDSEAPVSFWTQLVGVREEL